MDALIRAAPVGSVRTRLSELAPCPSVPVDAARDTLRREIERELRAEYEARWQKDAQTARERAREEGYAAGLAEAKSTVAQEIAQAHQDSKAQVDRLLDTLRDAQETLFKRINSDVGEIAFAAICGIAGDKACTREWVQGAVEKTFERLHSGTTASVRLHPRDLRLLRECLDGDELALKSLKLKIVSDESLQLGGCVVATEHGDYDGSLESQLRTLWSLLADRGAI